MATRLSPPKKVRLACRRCRTRRIKCDGETPACSNCAKAGEACLDVDGQNSAILVPRNFSQLAQARIQWLEAIIRERLPDVDLSDGPRVDLPTEPRPEILGAQHQPGESQGSIDASLSSLRPASQLRRPVQMAPNQPSLKRRSESTSTASHQEIFADRAHSVAMNLGMLALNSDSSQKHYLGSSSGLLFTHLIGASPSSDGSTPGTTSEDVLQHDYGVQSLSALTRESSRRGQRLRAIQMLEQELPRKDDAVQLVQTYIRSVHPDFPVLEPSSLMSALDALYAISMSPVEPDDTLPFGWPISTPTFRWNGRIVAPGLDRGDVVPLPTITFIIFMTFNLAALVEVRTRNYAHSPDKFYQTALLFAQSCFSQISLASIQGLVTLIVHSIFTPAETNLWTLLHVALAHCVEIGVHREELHETEDFDHQQTRRYVFYTIYSLDRSISSIQGRPLGFRDETFDIKLPERSSSPPGDGNIPSALLLFDRAVANYSTSQFKLDRIISDIKLHLYHLPGALSLFGTLDPNAQQTRIETSLKAWWDMATSESIDLSAIDRRQREIWRSKLKIKYYTTMVLLYQPSQAIRSPPAESLRICFDNASLILQTYQLLHDIHGLQYGWRSVQNIFAAGATLIYSFWTSASLREYVSPADLTRSLRTCTSLLTVGGEWWPSAKKCQASFDAVADLTIQRLFSEPGPHKIPRRISPPRREARQIPGEQAGVTASNLSTTFTHGTSSVIAGIDWEPAQDFSETWHDAQDAALLNSFVPEVENFLADFDRSEFSWSFPLFDSDISDIF